LPGAVSSFGPHAPIYVDPQLHDNSQNTRQRSRRRVAEDIALGITLNDDGDAGLAVLVQNHLEMREKTVSRIADVAPAETEITYIGRQKLLWTRARNKPLRLGCSISPANVLYSGTLGCFCRDLASGDVGILSNNHVLGNINRTLPGTPIVQAARGDRGRSPVDDIAHFARMVPIQFGGLPNAVDAAFAKLAKHNRGEDRATIFDSSNPPAPVVSIVPGNPVQAYPGMQVVKTGRTTGHRKGRVFAINVNNYLVNMPGVGVARFDNQIIFEMANNPVASFSEPGDSGSLIADGTGNPVALLFAGSASGGAGNVGFTAGNPISVVEAQLSVKLI
jgi:hypothetical protein